MKISQRIYLPFEGLMEILGSFVVIVVRFVFLWWLAITAAHNGRHLIECMMGPSACVAKLLGIERGR